MPAGARSRMQAEALQVVGGDRLFKPADIAARRTIGLCQGLLAAIGAVGVDEQLGSRGRCVAGGLHAIHVVRWVPADLHLDPRNAGGDPAAELLAKLVGGIGSEAAAAIDGGGVAARPREE